jgi:hypothetical protein
MVCERLEETTKQNQAIFDVCRDNGSALDLLLKERGLALPDKPGDEDEET